MAKFRGDSDDWLDDQRSKKHAGHKKKGGPKESPPLAPEEANATVAEVFPKLCRVRLDADATARLCSYRRANVMAPHGDEWRERAPVAVGDRVKVASTDPQSGVVEGVCARANLLARPAPDRDEGMIHVLAANLDALVIVASSANPVFSPGLVDRFLIAAQHAGIQPILCITKLDLQGDRSSWQPYLGLGFEIHEVCSLQGTGIAELKGRLSGKRVAFCGHSGVGKTSLINALIGRAVGRVGDMSDSTGKGRHTTTSAVMIETDDGSFWIDTPGVREFGLWGVAPEQLASYFPEFRDQPWARDGRLPDEAQLEELSALARGLSYRRILQSLVSGEH